MNRCIDRCKNALEKLEQLIRMSQPETGTPFDGFATPRIAWISSGIKNQPASKKKFKGL
jgi:hypothetical protein